MGCDSMAGLNNVQDESNFRCNSVKPYLDHPEEYRKAHQREVKGGV